MDVECLTRKSSPRWTRLRCADFEPYVDQHNRGRSCEPSCLEGGRTLLRHQRQPLAGHQAYRPIGILTSHPPGAFEASSNLVASALSEILEETVTVRVYSWRCDKCQRTLHHRDRRTLEHSIEEHRLQRHGLEADKRKGLNEAKKLLAKLQQRLNRRYGI